MQEKSAIVENEELQYLIKEISIKLTFRYIEKKNYISVFSVTQQVLKLTPPKYNR